MKQSIEKTNTVQKKNYKNKITVISILVMLFILAANTFSLSSQPSTEELEKQITTLTTQLQEANTKIETLQEQNKLLTDENAELTQKLQDANNKLATLQNENTSLTTKNTEQSQQLQNANTQIANLQNKNSQLLNDLTNCDDFYSLAERIKQEIASSGKGKLVIETTTTTTDDPNAESNTTYSIDLSNAPTSSTIATTETVYITDTGEKYHRDGCSYLKQSKHSISKKDAITRGYTPCSRCNP